MKTLICWVLAFGALLFLATPARSQCRERLIREPSTLTGCTTWFPNGIPQ